MQSAAEYNALTGDVRQPVHGAGSQVGTVAVAHLTVLWGIVMRKLEVMSNVSIIATCLAIVGTLAVRFWAPGSN